jgi:hypothetical protein
VSANQEFKFPHQTEAEKPDEEEKLEVVIEDDTPVEDRNRGKMPDEIVEDLENDDLEEYSDKVKKRLSQMKRVWHDERREKERAAREREEAINFARSQIEENKALKKQLGVGERLFVQEVTKAATSELATAREKLKQAHESGDSDAIIAATEALADAKGKTREVSQLRPSLQEDEEVVQQPIQAPAARTAIAPDPKAETWRDKNEWFGSDPEMTALALGLHDKLVRSGMDSKSDEYYTEIDKTMRKRFPEYFEQEEKEDPKPPSTREQPPATRKPSTTVAPATRSTAPRQIRLNSSQIAIAKRLGISNEAYAKEVLKLEKQNG